MEDEQYKKVIPKYYLIKEQIKREIEEGNFKPGEKLPPERILMRMYNVSRLTLRYALDLLAREGYLEKKNGVGSFVKSTIDRNSGMGDEKNNLKAVQQFRTVDIILPEIEYFHGKVVNGIEDIFSRNNYETRLRVVDSELKRDKILSDVGRGVIKYCILSSNNRYILPYDILGIKNIPIVMLGEKKEYKELRLDIVTVDNIGEGYQTAEHLVKKGYKNIAFVSNWYVNKYAERDRYNGAIKYLENNKKKLSFVILQDEFDAQNVKFFVEKLKDKLKNITLPLGIITGNDIVAREVYKIIKMMEYNIPGDIGIVSFDNTDIAVTLEPPLTSMDLCREQLGREAAKLIIDHISGIKIDAPRKVILSTSIIERNSTRL